MVHLAVRCGAAKRLAALQDRIDELSINLRVKDETIKAQAADVAALNAQVLSLQDCERKVGRLPARVSVECRGAPPSPRVCVFVWASVRASLSYFAEVGVAVGVGW